jgi:hypothetical protein
MVGTTTDAIVHDVDSRWLMAYAAGFGSLDPCYLDTRRDGGIEAHPLFPVCLEWPAVLALGDLLRAAGLTRDEAARSVHYTHDLVIHRGVRPGDRTRTTATVTSIEPHRSGTLAVFGSTPWMTGEPIATTDMGSLYRHVTPGTTGHDPPRTEEEPDPVIEHRVPVAAEAAHVYTECCASGTRSHRSPYGGTGRPAGDHPARHGHAGDGPFGGDPPRRRRSARPDAGSAPVPGWCPCRARSDRIFPPADEPDPTRVPGECRSSAGVIGSAVLREGPSCSATLGSPGAQCPGDHASLAGPRARRSTRRAPPRPGGRARADRSPRGARSARLRRELRRHALARHLPGEAQLPFTPGLELCGRVLSAPPEAAVAPGERVIACAPRRAGRAGWPCPPTCSRCPTRWTTSPPPSR